MGTQEAITFGIPLIGIPLFGDQFGLVNIYVRKNIAIRLDIEDISEEKLDFALEQILYNSNYRYTYVMAFYFYI